mmetsp:Transcript_20856/g.52969  ORF Transcript_20856/g.52969 Transcript_20856/m.52969 type:complete len:236 (+) Transcript_20856:1619-2326(+)
MLQRVHLPLQHLQSIRPLIHDVNLRDHPDGPLPLRIHVTCDTQGVGVGQVGIGRCDGQDQAVLPLDVPHDKVSDLRLDVCRLVTDRHLGQSRQIDKRQIDHVRRKDLERDCLHIHPLVLAAYAVGILLDLLPDEVKILELLIAQVPKLAPFSGTRRVLKLQHQRPSGDDASAARQEISPHNGLEDRRLPDGLGPNDGNLGKVQRHRQPTLHQDILEVVDEREESFHDKRELLLMV